MLSLSEIEQYDSLKGQDLVHAKILLADQATALLHGQESLTLIHQATQQAFSFERVNGDLAGTLPTYDLILGECDQGVFLLDVLVGLKFSTSRREARQKIREHAVKVQDELITDELYQMNRHSFKEGPLIKVSLGAKKHGLIHLRSPQESSPAT